MMPCFQYEHCRSFANRHATAVVRKWATWLGIQELQGIKSHKTQARQRIYAAR
jgi:hypothetical protein